MGKYGKYIDSGAVVPYLTGQEKFAINTGADESTVAQVYQILNLMLTSKEFQEKADRADVRAVEVMIDELRGEVSESAVMRLNKLLKVFEQSSTLERALDEIRQDAAGYVEDGITGFKFEFPKMLRSVNGQSVVGSGNINITPGSIGAIDSASLQVGLDGLKSEMQRTLTNYATGEELVTFKTAFTQDVNSFRTRVEKVEQESVTSTDFEQLADRISMVVNDDNNPVASFFIGAITEEDEDGNKVLSSEIKLKADMVSIKAKDIQIGSDEENILPSNIKVGGFKIEGSKLMSASENNSNETYTITMSPDNGFYQSKVTKMSDMVGAVTKTESVSVNNAEINLLATTRNAYNYTTRTTKITPSEFYINVFSKGDAIHINNDGTGSLGFGFINWTQTEMSIGKGGNVISFSENGEVVISGTPLLFDGTLPDSYTKLSPGIIETVMEGTAKYEHKFAASKWENLTTGDYVSITVADVYVKRGEKEHKLTNKVDKEELDAAYKEIGILNTHIEALENRLATFINQYNSVHGLTTEQQNG
jgi:hypothetical protein